MDRIMAERDRKAKLKRKRLAKRAERARAKEVLAENLRQQARYVSEMIEGDDPREELVMSKQYDHHWNKGMPGGLPSPNARRAAIQRAEEKAARKKLKHAAAQKIRRKVKALGPTAVAIAGKKLGDAREDLAKIAENTRRIEEMVGPILEREGYCVGDFIPSGLPTKLLLSDREMDARLVTRLIAARTELKRAREAERWLSAEYARAKTAEARLPKHVAKAPASPATRFIGQAGPDTLVDPHDDPAAPPWL